jgi:LPXTG-motif cell wall-anchored protein
MSKIIGIAGVATALFVSLWSPIGLAQGNCGDIVFTDDITSQFPDAEDACLGVVTRDGREFARFEARITRVRGSEIEAEFKLPDGTWGEPVAFTAPSDARASVAGRSLRYREMARGQELNIYLPPDRWAIAVQTADTEFEAAPAISRVALTEPTQEVAREEVARLPSTGSPLPLLALLGALLTALGAGVVAPLRRKLERRA